MRILVTGVAGFIGMHVARRLLAERHEVFGLDNLNDYYDVSLKQARLAYIDSSNQFTFTEIDLTDQDGITRFFSETKPQIVINLAAQAGVRYSLDNPHSYINSNIIGFTNILEACRHHKVEHLVYASSSSVYGLNAAMPCKEGDNTDHPLALYGATKKANEVMAHSYSHLFDLPSTGLRFFTVYGPWMRPDMALFKFTEAILKGDPINIYNHGQMVRDFTYIDDIVEGVVRVALQTATADEAFDPDNPDGGTSASPWRVLNIGNGQPVQLMDYIMALEEALGVEVKKEYLPLQPGDMLTTSADTSRLDAWVGFCPDTPVKEGIARFVDWYLSYYKI